jgi:hypothetical protein
MNPSMNRRHVRAAVATALTALSLFCLIPRPAPAEEPAEYDWKILQNCDSLSLFIKDTPAGTLVEQTSVDSVARRVRLKTQMQVSAEPSASMMTMVESREYDWAGELVSATQQLSSPSGATSWSLQKDPAGAWTLAVTAGGITKRQPIAATGENLRNTYRIQRGIDARTITAGQQWVDSIFDLSSGKLTRLVTRCESTPDVSPGRWVFSEVNDLVQLPTRREVDLRGRSLREEMPPLLEGRRVEKLERAPRATPPDLSTLFSIPAERRPRPDETIALRLPAGVQLHPSVAMLYKEEKGRSILQPLPTACASERQAGLADSSGLFLQPTVTLQSDQPAIRRLADSLSQGLSDRCALIARLTDYVDHHIQNRNVATFSSALETLKAGFGDCGEHAVLLAALLRAERIEARVVLGAVFVPGKKGFFYHAWVMANAGGWLFADPALGRFPASRDYIPLIIDDTGENAYFLANLIERIGVDYVRGR